MKPKKEKTQSEPVEVKADEVANTSFVNPFDKGVSYADFLNAKGEKSVRDYCGENLTNDQIEWLEIELEHFKNKQ